MTSLRFLSLRAKAIRTGDEAGEGGGNQRSPVSA